MLKNAGILSFNEVSYEHTPKKPILIGSNFSVRRGAKMTLMGQNGAGKSTIFDLIMGKYKPDHGVINILPRTTMAISRQVIPEDEIDLTVRAFFQKRFTEHIYNIDPKIDDVLEIVNLIPKSEEIKKTFKDRIIRSFSGGQQARLLLASALIQNPEILLLDEPTNNLDAEGITHLTDFLKKYTKKK